VVFYLCKTGKLIDVMPDSPSQSILNDDGSLRKSGRTRKRPLPPDATYEHARSKRIDQSSTPMPFSPEDLRHVINGTGESPIQNGSRDGNPEGDDGEDDEPEEEPVWAEFSSDYYQGQHGRLAHHNPVESDTASLQ
jgi:hypothetical protein